MWSNKLLLAAVFCLVLTGAGCSKQVTAVLDLGFTVEAPVSYGDWSATVTGKSLSASFANNSDIYYVAAIPPVPGAGGRGATYSDNLGYRKNSDGTYSLNFIGSNWQQLSTEVATVIGEVPLKEGLALIITGTEGCVGPACFSTDQYLAYINTPNGSLPGGVFVTQKDNITLPEFKDFLKQVSID